jgi:hypothetical protein
MGLACLSIEEKAMDKNTTTNAPAAHEIAVPPSEQSTPALIRSFLMDARDLISKELEAAKLEFRTEAAQLKRAAIALATAGTVLLVGVLLLGLSLAYGLASIDALPQWAGFLIAGGSFVLAGGALVLFGRQQVKESHLPPTQTVRELAEDLEWIKEEGTS